MPKCRRLAADFSVALGSVICRVEQRLAVYDDLTLVRRFEEVQAAQERRFARTGRADDGERLAALERKTDILQNLVSVAKVFIQILDLKNRHFGASLP